MSPVHVFVDPSISVALYILCITLLVAIWKLLGYNDKEKNNVSDLSFQLDKEKPPVIKLFLSKITLLFHYLLALSFLVFVVLTLTLDYPLFNEDIINYKWNHFFMAPIFVLQLLTFFAASLLWKYASSQRIGRVINWGFAILCIGVIARVALHYFRYPTFHWVQFTNVLISTLFLLFIPLLSITVIKYMHTLTMSINRLCT